MICLPGPPRELRAIFDAEIEERVNELRSQAGEGAERIVGFAHAVKTKHGELPG